MRGIRRRTEPMATARALQKVHKSRSWSPTWPARKMLFRQTGGPAGANTYPATDCPVTGNPCDSRSPESLRSDILGMCDACKCQNPDRMLRVQQDRFHLSFPAVQGNAHIGRGLFVASPPRGVKFFLRNFLFSRCASACPGPLGRHCRLRPPFPFPQRENQPSPGSCSRSPRGSLSSSPPRRPRSGQ